MAIPKKRRFPKIKGRDYFGVFPDWRVTDDWGKVPFTHTTTQTTCYGIPHFNPGTSLYLVEDRAPLPGELFIWARLSCCPSILARCRPRPTMRIASA